MPRPLLLHCTSTRTQHRGTERGSFLASALKAPFSLGTLSQNGRLARPISLALPTPVHAMTDKQTVIMTICMERAITCHNAPLVMGTLAESTLGVSGEEIKHSPVHRAARARLHSRPVLSGTTGPKGLGRLAPLRGAPPHLGLVPIPRTVQLQCRLGRNVGASTARTAPFKPTGLAGPTVVSDVETVQRSTPLQTVARQHCRASSRKLLPPKPGLYTA